MREHSGRKSNMMKTALKKWFSIKTITMLVCYSIVGWQTIECLIKYSESPQGTKLKMVSPQVENLPAITVCKAECPRYNESILKSCNLQRYFNK